MATREVIFELREDTAAAWASVNPTLRAGEPGYERDTNKLKIGNGNTAWNDLAYLVGSGGAGAVDSVFGRTGVITAQTGDYTKAQVGLGNVDNTADSAKPVSTATQTALNAKADLVGGSVPYAQLPVLAFRGSWASGTAYETGDSVMFSESLFGTVNGVAADVEPFTSTKLLTGTPTNVDTGDAGEYEFFSYFDVSVRARMTGLTFRKVVTQTDVPITVRLWDRDVSLVTPLLVKTISPAPTFAGEVVVPLLWDLLPGKNYAVSFTTGLGSGTGYAYTPSFAFPLNVGVVTLRNAGFSTTIGSIAVVTTGTLYWVGIQWQEINTGWTRLANLDPPEGAKGAKGDTGAAGSAGATGPTGPQGDGAYPLAGYGFHSASIPIEAARSDSTHGNSWSARVWVPAGKAINTIGLFVTQTGTAGSGNNAFAVYDDSGNFVASTPTDDNLWVVASPQWVLRNLSSPIAAQGSGRFVYVASSRNGGTDPSIAYWNVGFGENMMSGGPSGKYRSLIPGGMSSSFPSTINVTTPGTNFAYVPLYVLA